MSHLIFSPKQLHGYQKTAIIHQCRYPDTMLWLDMGLGKTVITLSTIDYRMRANQIKKTLIFGPLRVIHSVWENEAKKWEHLKHLRFQVIQGSERKREQKIFNNNVDIYLINYENMAWLANLTNHYYLSKNSDLPWQMVVYDEVTRVKKANTVRMSGGKKYTKEKQQVNMYTSDGNFDLINHGFHKGDSISFNDPVEHLNQNEEYFTKHLSKNRFSIHNYSDSPAIILPLIDYQGELNVKKEMNIPGWKTVLKKFKYRTGLTGTPAPNGYGDLHGQYLAVDGGERLGWFSNNFKTNYMVANFNDFGHRVTETGIKMIEKQIQDITVKMSAKDYLTLPDSIINDIIVNLPPSVRNQYNELEKEFFTQLDEQNDIEVFNAASLSNKCLQFCNGSPFLNPGEPEWYSLHDVKLKALENVLEEASGSPVLVAYLFRPDAERMMKSFKQFKPINITETKPKGLRKAIQNIINGKHQLIIGHPASMGHGIDGLQNACHIGVWFGLNWNLEYYQQFMGRYIRQGQKKTTITHRIICSNTMDEVVRSSLAEKNTGQEYLKKSIQRYRDEQLYNFW